ncbi:hypothetical protein [Gemmatimonas sp.]|uniref:hypothetical protein n=1 Tax=Gemmatimonas sp. TaxID=1962908 RepID=UPI0039192594
MRAPLSPGPETYGPNTAAIRRFLVRLAGLGIEARSRVTDAYAAEVSTRAWMLAETALATAIERSGREPQRDALSGPLLQLVQRDRGAAATATAATATAAEATDEDRVLDTLDPVAEPALAALLALLVCDLLDGAQLARLMAPFEGVIALTEVTTGAR